MAKAVDGTTGQSRWAFAMYDEVHSPPSVGPDGTQYVGSSDGKVNAIR